MSVLRCTRFPRTSAWHAFSSSTRSRLNPTCNQFNTISNTPAPTMASTLAESRAFPVTPYTPKHTTWPYTPSDFQRADESPDPLFYTQPRLVTHIDDAAIARLTAYYDTVLPLKGRILDLCTSWTSFYPASTARGVQDGQLEVFGVGLNAEEMKRNPVFGNDQHWRVLDLNQPPYDARAAWEVGRELSFDAVTCVVSIDYLTHPREVCEKLLDAVKEGGSIQLVISNRCFPSKVVRRWMMLSEAARLEFVGGMSPSHTQHPHLSLLTTKQTTSTSPTGTTSRSSICAQGTTADDV